MNKTKIEWCDYTWNPVTGCLHNCPYCYARRIANRFGGASETHYNDCVGVECQWYTEETGETHDLTEPIYDVDRGQNAPYPFGFDPTFFRYRLIEPQKLKKPSKIFVVSMGDLFGEWVPDEWIKSVFEACEKAPQHTYLFLTKNPERYTDLYLKKAFPYKVNFWFGSTITKYGDDFTWFRDTPYQSFLSIEPLLERMINPSGLKYINWVIVGAETGNRKDKVVPKKEWVQDIVNWCRELNIPVFMKDSLIPIWGEDLIREYPKGIEEAEQ